MMFNRIKKQISDKKILRRYLGAKNDYRGFVAIVALLIISSLVALVVYSISISIQTKRQVSNNLLSSAQSYYMAESGMEDAVLRVLKNYSYTALNSFTLDGATVGQNITQTGNVLDIATDSNYSNNVRKLTSSLTITTSNISFHYGVQVGEGGLSMAQGTKINGNIYSDGSIDGAGASKSEITGDAYVATGMTLDTNGDWENYTSDRDFGAKNSPSIDVAMKFVPASGGHLSQVAFYTKRSSTAPASGTIRILKDKAGLPSNLLSDQLASTTFDVAKIGTTYGWINYSFSSPATLTAGTTYWIVIDTSESNSVSKYYDIGRSASNTDISKYSADWTGGSWTPGGAGNDGGYAYKAWIGGAVTELENVKVDGNAHANTIQSSTIGGDAYYQSITGSTVTGTSYPGSPDPPVEAMPVSSSNIVDWEASAASSGNLSTGLCNSSSANITLDAGVLDCTASGAFAPSSSSLTITLNGIVWIKGNITLPNNSLVVLSSGYGGKSGILIADAPDPMTGGKIDTGNGSVICGSQGYIPGNPPVCNASNGSYIMFLSTHNNPADYAINISNNASGAVYYAFAGTANLNNNSSNVKEVTAYRLLLQQNTSVNYESGLASATFSTGPGAGWQLNSWNETQ